MNPWQVLGDVLPGLGRILERVHGPNVWSYRPLFHESRDSAQTVPRRASLIIAPTTRCLAVSSGDTGWTAETRWPPSFKTKNDRFCVSPPIKSKTTSTFSRRAFSNCASRYLAPATDVHDELDLVTIPRSGRPPRRRESPPRARPVLFGEDNRMPAPKCRCAPAR
jgi:hypothetical protein